LYNTFLPWIFALTVRSVVAGQNPTWIINHIPVGLVDEQISFDLLLLLSRQSGTKERPGVKTLLETGTNHSVSMKCQYFPITAWRPNNALEFVLYKPFKSPF